MMKSTNLHKDNLRNNRVTGVELYHHYRNSTNPKTRLSKADWRRVVTVYFDECAKDLQEGLPVQLGRKLGFVQLCRKKKQVHTIKQIKEKGIKGGKMLWKLDGHKLYVFWSEGNCTRCVKSGRNIWAYWSWRYSYARFRELVQYFVNNTSAIYNLPLYDRMIEKYKNYNAVVIDDYENLDL